MKRIAAILIALTFALVGCVNHLPKPTNANGTLNPSVAVAEAKITYTNAANDAAVYAETCHATTPAPIGCNDQVIAQLKVQGKKTLDAINAAEQAVKTLQPGATGIDSAIANMNAALIFLQSLLNTAKHPGKVGMLETLNILDGVVA